MNNFKLKISLLELNANRLRVACDSVSPKSAGIIFLANGQSILLIKRSADSEDYPLHWAFPAGKIESLEKPIYAAMRECEEEIGFSIDAYDTPPKLMAITDKGFYCYLYKEHGQFKPILNNESVNYGWFTVNNLPKPMHPDALNLIRKLENTVDEQLINDIGKGWIAFINNEWTKDNEYYWYVCPKTYYEKHGHIQDGHAFDGIKLNGLEEVADHVLFANDGTNGVDSLKKYKFEIIKK